MTILLRLTVATLLCGLVAAPMDAQSLRGSPASVERQYRVAHDHGFTFLRTSSQVRQFVASGYLVHLPGNQDYTLANVSHPYARPEVKLFVERLSAQYRAACGERLVVTSLTRPLNGQPANASSRSVHPAGMAVDLRVSQQPACRIWLESALLNLERQGVVSATRERRPPHYHVAVFPRQYARYVASLPDPSLPRVAADVPDPSLPRVTADVSDPSLPRVTADATYRVRRGDSLWSIARNYGVDVDSIKEANRLPSTRIYAGQTLQIPVAAN
jgi:hypothetical protein